MIKELSSLRFVLIMMIFLHHCNLFSGGGDLAVTGFFMLSGFVVTYGYGEQIKTSSFNYRIYLLRRVFRIVPMHWLCLFVSFLLLWHGDALASVSLPNFVANLFLLQSYVPDRDVYFSFNSLSWYLSSLFLFYILFPYLFRKRTSSWILFAIYAFLALNMSHDYTEWVFYICPAVRMADCVLGMYLAILCKKMVKVRRYSPVRDCIIIALLAVQVIISQTISADMSLHACVYWPLYALIFIFVVLNGTGEGILSNKNLVIFGNYVLELYLVHQLCIEVVTLVLWHFGCDNSAVICVLSFAVTAFAAVICHRYFAKPVFAAASKRFGLGCHS